MPNLIDRRIYQESDLRIVKRARKHELMEKLAALETIPLPFPDIDSDLDDLDEPDL